MLSYTAKMMQEQFGMNKDMMVEVAQLKDGKSFGELALTTNKPRAATIRADTEVHLAVLCKEDYQKILGKI